MQSPRDVRLHTPAIQVGSTYYVKWGILSGDNKLVLKVLPRYLSSKQELSLIAMNPYNSRSSKTASVQIIRFK